MDGWEAGSSGARESPRDEPTPRERISAAEARLEIGGGAQWGAGIATWDDMSLLESRADMYLYSKFTHLRGCVDLLWRVNGRVFLCKHSALKSFSCLGPAGLAAHTLLCELMRSRMG